MSSHHDAFTYIRNESTLYYMATNYCCVTKPILFLLRRESYNNPNRPCLKIGSGSDGIFLPSRKDSVVTNKINYDLLKTAHSIQMGSFPAPTLLGSSTVSKTNEDIPKAFSKMMSKDCP